MTGQPFARRNPDDQRRELHQAIGGFFAHWRYDHTADRPAATFKPAFDLHGRVDAHPDGWHWTAWIRGRGELAGGPEASVEAAMATVDVLLAGHVRRAEDRR
jgi:hypothetical protein